MTPVIIKNFTSYQQDIPQILTEANLGNKIKNITQILIKPNLTIDHLPPCTTPVKLVEEVVKYCQHNSPARIIIAEGSGGCETDLAFRRLGYYQLVQQYNIELLDLNTAKRIEKTNPHALKLKHVKLPQIAFESYIINLPVLKLHGAAKMTAAMKNLFGFYLNNEYIDKAIGIASRMLKKGWWNKSELHLKGINQSVIDLYRYLQPDFNLVDGSIGQDISEVYGQPFNPPIGKLIAGYDARSVDIECAKLLHLENQIRYLSKYHK